MLREKAEAIRQSVDEFVARARAVAKEFEHAAVVAERAMASGLESRLREAEDMLNAVAAKLK